MERNPEVRAKEALPRPAEAVAQTDQPCFVRLQRSSPGVNRICSPFQLLYGRSVRGPGTILKELWTKEVNIPEVNSSYEYVTELRKRLEGSLKLAQEELENSEKRYKRHYDRKAKPRQLEVDPSVDSAPNR